MEFIKRWVHEKDYTDNRHPENIEWGKNLEEDLKRRDFTINSMALSLHHHPQRGEDEGENYQLIDPFYGQNDLEKKLVRAVGDPNQRL